jgi:putative oxidoreductase
MKKLFAVTTYSLPVDLSLQLLRVIMGIAFMLHGWGKIQTPFSWMPPEAPVPGFFQFLAALSEFGGGLGLIIGLLFRLSSAGIFFTMLVAVGMHAFTMGDPFVNLTGGRAYELPALYGAIALLFVFSGPGRVSLDSKIFGKR